MIKLSNETVALVEELERRIDPETEEDFVNQWRNFLFDRFEGDIFIPNRKKPFPTAYNEIEMPNINDAVADLDLMIRAQLLAAVKNLSTKNKSICIRANYGTGILSSVFGAEIFCMPRENNTLPTTRSLNDTEKIRETVERGMPDLCGGFGKRVFEFGELCAELFEKYPKVKKYVKVYHPDLQGPLDICELLWGGEMFYALYDEPELVHGMLSLATNTYIAFMDKWSSLVGGAEDINPHWATLYHRGGIVIRNDSAMNLSPDLYREFAAPYDGALLKRYGGAVHFCGRGDHYIDILCSLEGLYGINMTQPHLNDMEKIYRNTVDKGIKLLAFKRERADRDVCRAGGFNHSLSSV